MRYDELPDQDSSLNNLIPTIFEFPAVCSYVVSGDHMSGEGIVEGTGGPHRFVYVLAV